MEVRHKPPSSGVGLLTNGMVQVLIRVHRERPLPTRLSAGHDQGTGRHSERGVLPLLTEASPRYHAMRRPARAACVSWHERASLHHRR